MAEKKTEKEKFLDKSYKYEETYEGSGNVIPVRFGLCSRCDSFLYVQYDSEKEYIGCTWDHHVTFNIPNGENPVRSCSMYTKKGQTSLMEMANMAYYINDKKNKIGFE